MLSERLPPGSLDRTSIVRSKAIDPCELILCAIGAALLFAAWYYDILPWKVIKAILTEVV